MRYRAAILYCTVIVLFLALCLGGVAAYMYNYQKIQYPGEGVYDLTKYVPCFAEGYKDEGNTEEIVAFEFLTDSTEIAVVNESDSCVTVRLYDTADEQKRAIGTFSLEPGKSKKFTNLTSARTYFVGVEPEEDIYAITISD